MARVDRNLLTPLLSSTRPIEIKELPAALLQKCQAKDMPEIPEHHEPNVKEQMRAALAAKKETSPHKNPHAQSQDLSGSPHKKAGGKRVFRRKTGS